MRVPCRRTVVDSWHASTRPTGKLFVAGMITYFVADVKDGKRLWEIDFRRAQTPVPSRLRAHQWLMTNTSTCRPQRLLQIEQDTGKLLQSMKDKGGMYGSILLTCFRYFKRQGTNPGSIQNWPRDIDSGKILWRQPNKCGMNISTRYHTTTEFIPVPMGAVSFSGIKRSAIMEIRRARENKGHLYGQPNPSFRPRLPASSQPAFCLL